MKDHLTESVTRSIRIAAPPAKVWAALTQAREFGTWFKVDLEGPFVEGTEVHGTTTYPGFEGLPFAARVERIEPQRHFVFTWPPYAGPEHGDLTHLPWTQVEFVLDPDGDGTRVTVTESGFASLPADIGAKVLTGNTEGWEIQLRNLAAHVA